MREQNNYPVFLFKVADIFVILANASSIDSYNFKMYHQIFIATQICNS